MIIYITIQTSAGLTELLMFNDLQNILEVGFLCFKQSEVNRRVLYKIGAEKIKKTSHTTKWDSSQQPKHNTLLITSFFPQRETTNLSIKSTCSSSNFIRQTQMMNYGQQRTSHLRESRLRNLIKFLTMFRILQTILTLLNLEKLMIQLLKVCFLYEGEDYERKDFQNDSI